MCVCVCVCMCVCACVCVCVCVCVCDSNKIALLLYFNSWEWVYSKKSRWVAAKHTTGGYLADCLVYSKCNFVFSMNWNTKLEVKFWFSFLYRSWDIEHEIKLILWTESAIQISFRNLKWKNHFLCISISLHISLLVKKKKTKFSCFYLSVFILF